MAYTGDLTADEVLRWCDGRCVSVVTGCCLVLLATVAGGVVWRCRKRNKQLSRVSAEFALCAQQNVVTLALQTQLDVHQLANLTPVQLAKLQHYKPVNAKKTLQFLSAINGAIVTRRKQQVITTCNILMAGMYGALLQGNFEFSLCIGK